MSTAVELHWVTPGLVVWQAYVPDLKVDCTSTAVATPLGWLLIDPILLDEGCMEELRVIHPLAAIALTSGNHQRASLAMQARYGLQIYAPSTADLVAHEWIKPGERIFESVEVLDMSGGGPGELALLADDVMIFGDGVINLGELTLLPDKYCEDSKQLRQSLRAVAAREFGIGCFAHGLPIVNDAAQRVRGLVDAS